MATASHATVRSAGWRRVGAIGFVFFLVKGLLWLALPVLAAFGLAG